MDRSRNDVTQERDVVGLGVSPAGFLRENGLSAHPAFYRTGNREM